MNKDNKFTWPISRSILITALAFGMAAMISVTAGIYVPVMGGIRLDLRELFVTLGAALSGPIGGVLAGGMAQSWFSDQTHLGTIPSILAHTLSGLWMGVTYKTLVYQRLKMPWLLLGWIGLVVVYYYGVLALVFTTSCYVFYPAEFEVLFGKPSLWQAYTALLKAATPELIATGIFTAIIMAILPPKYRRPLW